MHAMATVQEGDPEAVLAVFNAIALEYYVIYAAAHELYLRREY